jgi:putative ABC transport system permease protein
VLLFHVKLALSSLRRTPWTTLIAVLTIGLGVGVATTMTGVHHLFAQNPLPEKGAVLFNVRIDAWDPNTEFFNVPVGDPPKSVTYMDMTGLMRAEIPARQTGVANARAYAFPDQDDGRVETWQTVLQLVHADFFAMFEVPFRHGAPWTEEMEARNEAVCVLSQPANDKLFGGADSVGRKIRLGSRDFTIVGVLERWRPTPKVYDPINSFVGEPREFFVPFELIRQEDIGLSITGDTDGWGSSGSSIFDSELYWIQLWVELPPERREAYVAFVDDYCRELKALGRHPRPLNSRVTPMMEWVRQWNDGASISMAMAIIALLFLVICSINLLGLLLGKFLARAPRIGIHRALGASRASVFVQHVTECELVGVLGGLIGLGFAVIGLRLIERILPAGAVPEGLFALDAWMVVVALLLALVSGLIAGLYPAWRACRIAPAMQINLQ